MTELIKLARSAREAAFALGVAGTAAKNAALNAIADALLASEADILAANAEDVARATEAGISAAFIERLTLNHSRLEGMAQGVRQVAALDDPIGKVDSGWTRPNGLRITKRRVPLGVIGIIFESRPNVTSDAASLCLKAGNAVILRGGSDALRSNIAIVRAMRGALESAGLPADAVCLVEDTSHETAQELMKLNGLVDVLIPRGGKRLIKSVVENSRVPVIQTGDGVCHTYVAADADLDMALEIVINAKVSRPSVCNAMETLLIDSSIAAGFAPRCAQKLQELGVELRGCERTRALCPGCAPASDEDWDTEYNDMILSVRIVDGLDAAIDHINTHGTRHSEAIITRSLSAAKRFQDMVDAACVYVNASTRFTDGGEFGFGAEIGISNQKLHARGPMGLDELTTYKYLIDGDGQIRA